jgi:two-component system response regulator YesN
MNKVLIVDDEPMIRNGLTTLVDWERHGFAIVGTAANGKEAVEKHAELSPDLILIDIRMPGMDGLQAISEIRRTDTQCHILILSGYADFNYAKQAIAHSVDGYILKPIDEDELESYVERVGALLKQRFEQQVISDQSIHLLREELLQEVALGRTEGESKLKEQQALFGDAAKSYQLLLIDLYSREHSLSLKAAVRKKLEARIEQERRGWVFFSEPYVGILLKDYTLQQDAGEQMERLIAECCGERVKFTAVTAKPGRTLNEVHASAGEIRRLLKQRFLLEGERIHFASPGPF